MIRLVDAVPLEQSDEWQISRRYMSLESLATVLRSSGTDEADKLTIENAA